MNLHLLSTGVCLGCFQLFSAGLLHVRTFTAKQSHLYTARTFSVSPLQVESLYHKLRVLLHASDVLLNLSKHCQAESWYQYWIPTPFYWRAFQLSTHNGVSILPKQRLNLLVTFFHFIKKCGGLRCHKIPYLSHSREFHRASRNQIFILSKLRLFPTRDMCCLFKETRRRAR